MKKILFFTIVLAGVTAPMIVMAAGATTIREFFATKMLGIINAITTVLVAVATLVFIYGIILYIAAGGADEKMKTARSYIVFSIIGLALILGIWGIATFLVEGLGFNTVINSIPVPGGALTP